MGEPATRWTSRPLLAAGLRVAVFVAPLALSAAVAFAVLAILPLEGAPPVILAGAWIGLGVATAVVMFVTDRLARRLLPVAAFMRLSLVLPDGMPSRFAAASARLTPEQLAREVDHARAGHPGDSSSEAAARLLRLVAELADHDALTRGHSERVRAYSQIIGESLGVSDDDLDRLNWAALLHDVGKLAVPGEVLNKRGRPSDEEWDQLKAHAEEGARMAAPLAGWLGEWFPAISEHHERWDGSGYPAGLAGEEISLAGRVVAVADAYDVMTSDRTYSRALTRADALEELAECSGSHFDPLVVRAMIDASAALPRFAYGSGGWFGPLPLLGRFASAPTLAPNAASTILASAALVGAGTLAPPTLSAAASLVAPPPAVAPAAASSADRVPAVAADRSVANPPEDSPREPGETGGAPAEGSASEPRGEDETAPVPSSPPRGGSGTGAGPGTGAGESSAGSGGSEPRAPVPPVLEEVVDVVETVAPPVVKDIVDTVEAVVPTEVIPTEVVPVPEVPATPPPVELPPAVPSPPTPPMSPTVPGGGLDSVDTSGNGVPVEIPPTPGPGLP